MEAKIGYLSATALIVGLVSTGSAIAQTTHAGHGMMAEISALGDPAKATQTVAVTMNDNYFEPERISVPAGATVRFVVKNEGSLLHEFNTGRAASVLKIFC